MQITQICSTGILLQLQPKPAQIGGRRLIAAVVTL